MSSSPQNNDRHIPPFHHAYSIVEWDLNVCLPLIRIAFLHIHSHLGCPTTRDVSSFFPACCLCGSRVALSCFVLFLLMCNLEVGLIRQADTIIKSDSSLSGCPKGDDASYSCVRCAFVALTEGAAQLLGFYYHIDCSHLLLSLQRRSGGWAARDVALVWMLLGGRQ